MQTRLFTFLGTNNYQEVCYLLGAQKARPSCFVQIALCQLLQIREAFVFLTKEAEERNWKNLLEEAEKAGLQLKPVQIPSQGGTQDMWDIFRALGDALKQCPLESRIHLDITHGFRAVPFFAAAFVAYSKMAIRNSADIAHVWYGQGPSSGEKPEALEIWDLSPFLELMEWTVALKEFLDSGKAEKLNQLELVRKNHRSIGEAHKDGNLKQREFHQELQNLIKTVSNFSEAFLANRCVDLMQGNSLSAQVLSALQACRENVDQALPPLKPVLGQIENMLSDMNTANLRGSEGFSAWLKLAGEQERMGRYTDALVTVGEGIRNYYLEGELLDMDARAASWSRVRHIRDLNAANGLRNDLAHGGYRENAIPGANARKCLASCLKNLIEKGLPELEDEPSQEVSSVFLNISNHPHQSWSDAQKAAALTFAPRIADLEFPHVNPEATPEEIEEIVRGLVSRLPAGVTHAMVQGEFTTTFALVKALQKKKVLCFAATTVRNVTEDENGAKVSKFEFHGFREYGGLY